MKHQRHLNSYRRHVIAADSRFGRTAGPLTRSNVLSSGIGALILLAIAAVIIALSANQISNSESWVEAAGHLAIACLKVFAGISLISLFISAASFSNLVTRYRSLSQIKDIQGEPHIELRAGMKKILAYRITHDKIFLIYSDDGPVLGRESLYCSKKALTAMRELLENQYDMSEVAISNEALAKTIQRLNSDEELRRLAKQSRSKYRTRRSLARVFKSSANLIDIENPYLRASTRLGAVIDILWASKTEATEFVFELAFREVMADDIRLGKDGMNLRHRILSREQDA